MSCRKLSEIQLWELLDDALAPADRQVVERHLADCPRCSLQLSEYRRRPLPIGELTMLRPPPGFQQRVMVRIQRETEQRELAGQLGWLAPLLAPARLVAVSTTAVMVALLSMGMVGVILASPAAAAEGPSVGLPLADSMRLALRQAVVLLAPLIHDWGWGVLLLGMLASVLMAGLLPLSVVVRRQR